MDELKEKGIEILFVTVSTPKNSEEKILHGVRGLFAEYERAKISERFRLGKMRKIKEGHILVSEPAYGYSYIPRQENRHGYYEVNESEAHVVRDIFSWVANEGLTIRKVIARLHKEGVKPRKSKRGVWSSSTLSTLLKNPVYIGKAKWGSSFAVVPENPLKNERYKKLRKTSRRMKPKEEWLFVSVPAIITKELFNRAQEQIQNNFELCNRNKKNQYLLAGKIRCTCGKTRAGEGPQNGRYLYYRCADRVSCYPLQPNCREKGINARVADTLIWDKIVELMSSPRLIKEQIIRLQKRKTEGNPAEQVSAVINKEIVKLKETENRYNTAYGSGVLSLEQLKEYVVPIRGRISQLESRNEQEHKKHYEREVKIPDEDEIEAFTVKSQKALKNLHFEARRAIVINVLDKVVGNKESLQVYGCIPITNVGLFTNHRDGLNINRHNSEDIYVPFYFTLTLGNLL